jgi:hypothetical protein
LDESTNGERYAEITENPFLETARAPLSTFSIDVDTASYANVRRFLNNGQLPPKDSVRIDARLARMGADVRSIPLLETIREEETQGTDPHPNAETERALALWTAESLLELGWIPGAPVAPLPEVPHGFAGRRTRELDADEVLSWSADFERAALEDLERVVDEDSLRGMLQIYGGLNVDGTFGPRLAAVLPAGRRLAVTLAPFAERADLYPLEVAVEVEGAPLGTVPLATADSGPVRREFELPAVCAGRPFEVLLKSDRWCIHKILVVSARFRGLESLE